MSFWSWPSSYTRLRHNQASKVISKNHSNVNSRTLIVNPITIGNVNPSNHISNNFFFKKKNSLLVDWSHAEPIIQYCHRIWLDLKNRETIWDGIVVFLCLSFMLVVKSISIYLRFCHRVAVNLQFKKLGHIYQICISFLYICQVFPINKYNCS